MKTGLPDARVEVLGYPSIIRLAVLAGAADATRSIEYGPMAGFFVPGAKLDPGLSDDSAGFDVIFSFLHDPDGHFEANLLRPG